MAELRPSAVLGECYDCSRAPALSPWESVCHEGCGPDGWMGARRRRNKQALEKRKVRCKEGTQTL